MTLLATTDLESAGTITYWSLRGETDQHALKDAWLAAGLDPTWAPPPPSAENALARTLRERAHKGGWLVRPLKERGTWGVVRETQTGTKLSAELGYELLFKVWLNTDKSGLTFAIEEADVISPSKVEDVFLDTVKNLSTTEMSSWLVALCARYVNAVSLRSTGGIYFVPPSKAEEWREVLDVIEQSGAQHTIYTVPTMDTEDAAAAVLAAVTREASDITDRIAHELDNGWSTDRPLGKRALRNRKQACEQMAVKLRSYEEMLGEQLTAIKEKLVEVSSSIAEAQLAEGIVDE